ncbi:DUF559 domain-containing protein [Priestia megaterium]|uniref:DUF559 domain-containing protein n=1 Tax=Priestia megaterium TaxID=1404 RepID=UPI0034587E71
MTIIWANSTFESFEIHEMEWKCIEDEGYYNKVFNNFPKHTHWNPTTSSDIKNLISEYDNWHIKLESDLEATVYNSLIKEGLKPLVNPLLTEVTDQTIIGESIPPNLKSYRLDLVLYIQKHPILWIEVDGSQHKEQIISDAEREVLINEVLPRTYLLRVEAKEIRTNINSVASMIEKAYYYTAKRHLLTEKFQNELTSLNLDYKGIFNELKERTALSKRNEDLAQFLRELDC